MCKERRGRVEDDLFKDVVVSVEKKGDRDFLVLVGHDRQLTMDLDPRVH